MFEERKGDRRLKTGYRRKRIVFLGFVCFVLLACETFASKSTSTPRVLPEASGNVIKPQNLISISCVDQSFKGTKFGEDIAELLNHVEVDKKWSEDESRGYEKNLTLKITFHQKDGNIGSLTLVNGIWREKSDSVMWSDNFLQWDGNLVWLKEGKLVKFEKGNWTWVDQAEDNDSAEPLYNGASTSKLDEAIGNILVMWQLNDSSIKIESNNPLW